MSASACGSGCTHAHHEAPELLEADLVILGAIGAPFGVKGWQHIHSYTDPVVNILQYPVWYIQNQEVWMPFYLKEGRRHGKGIVARLKGIQDRDAAALFSNAKVAVERSQLAPLSQDEFYWSDLEGLTVQTEKGHSLGQVLYVYQNVGMDVLVVKNTEKERHIPFLMHETILKVDLNVRQITVDWDATL